MLMCNTCASLADCTVLRFIGTKYEIGKYDGIYLRHLMHEMSVTGPVSEWDNGTMGQWDNG
jgi:hypothetical protein